MPDTEDARDKYIAKLEAALNHVDDLVTIYDEDDCIIYSNVHTSGFKSMAPELFEVGTTFEQSLREFIAQGFVPAAKEKTDEWIRERVQRHRNPRGAFNMYRVGGKRHRIREFPLNGGGIVTIREDMSPLREAEALFSSTFDHMTVGGVIVDGNGDIQQINPIACEIFGFEHTEIIGANITRLLRNEDGSQVGEFFEDSPGIHALEGPLLAREAVGLRKDGSAFPIYLGIGKAAVEDKPTFIASISDLSDLKSLQQQLLRAQRLEAVGQLTGGVAHDFNNLLGIMLGNAEMLGDLVDGDPQAATYVDNLQRAVERASSLTHRLLAFSRQQTLLPKASNVSGLIKGLDDMLRRTLGEQVELEIDLQRRTWPALIDGSQFEHALINLAVNARDAMPKGGRLTIAATNITLDKTQTSDMEDVAPGDYVVVTVNDTGTGMSPDVQKQVFEPFFTTKGVGEGSGLGLSMVYGFAKQSKGHIGIDSTIDVGTTVSLYMPRSQSALSRDTGDEHPDTGPGQERILVVEDDDLLRQIPTSILTRQGYFVCEARDGDEAIKRLSNDPPYDLLFTDIVLPGGLSGDDIAREAKVMNPAIRVLYTTGYTQNAIADQGGLDTDIRLVNKPYQRNQLLATVRSVLDGDA